MMMNKRKQSDVCSDSSSYSVVYNPETVFDLNAESSCGSVGKIPRLNLNESMEFNLFHGFQLNGAPFNDFFVSKTEKVSEKDCTETGVCLDLTLSLSLPQSVAPACTDKLVLSNTVLSDDATPVCSDSSIYSTDSETETETVLDVMPLSMHIPDDVNVAAAVETDAGWTIKKVLTESDCNDQHRLLIRRKLAEEHILKYFDELSRKKIDSPSGLRLDMFDCDTGSWVRQTLKRRPSNGSIGLMSNWKRDFVVRRGLKEGDEVGFCWDDQYKTLLFRLLRKAPLVDN